MASGLVACIAEPSHRHSFTPLWQPPFLASIEPGRRGHLSGLSVADGRPQLATLMALDGNALRDCSGGLVDVVGGEAIATGLDHPAMPRVAADATWLIEVSAGTLTRVERDGDVQRVAALPGLTTSLVVHEDVAFVGLTSPHGHPGALGPTGPLADSAGPHRTGLAAVDLTSGQLIAHAWFEQTVHQVTGVAAITQRRAPMAIGFETEELRHTSSIGEPRWTGTGRTGFASAFGARPE
jgi:uncharacterized protein (TIGR03032 family)